MKFPQQSPPLGSPVVGAILGTESFRAITDRRSPLTTRIHTLKIDEPVGTAGRGRDRLKVSGRINHPLVDARFCWVQSPIFSNYFAYLKTP